MISLTSLKPRWTLSNANTSRHHSLCYRHEQKHSFRGIRSCSRHQESEISLINVVSLAESLRLGVPASQENSCSDLQWVPISVMPASLIAVLLHLSQPCLPPAHAILSSPNAQIARTVDAALRRSIPAFNPDVAKVQSSLEDIQYLLRIPQRKPWASMSKSLSEAVTLATEHRSDLLKDLPSDATTTGSDQLDDLVKRMQQLDLAIKTQQPDLAGLRVSQSLKAVANLELLQAPGLPFSIPKDYASLPRLTGRATVELIVEKKDGSLAFIDQVAGGLTKEGRVTVVVDGYSAPITAGNFVANVLDGLYDGRVLQSNYSSMYVAGKVDKPRPPIPLEILPLGQFDPVYRSPLDVQGGELPVLPLSISGAITMAHIPDSDSFLSGDEWFVFKFDKQQAGLSGLAFDEGTFSVFGYVTDGMDTISKLKSGDVIVSAAVIEGKEKLVRSDAAA
ncbi:hypothetical protein CEUSTIGMA_g4668.t1 [Chlamydomonas eustigma]|uniref:PPIase cyclophilin-type domain-containing protein n=1 Tax=Chlamydomonas eustigma TaxID=1157962 RepID=A0A250X2U8_9CHLO|nr:hypothetical protein CEUSTIGMA_g4668.t1 [Chlamydomonas eustigma]|eukprot:GAX77222.1 hypothetical protein CEUSTIGMA_g4668.t1 [Chlamydomonas eustigma]